MSQEPWEIKMRKIVAEELAKKSPTTTETQSPPSSEKKEEGHGTIEDLMNCPDCYPKAEKIVVDKLKKSEWECSDCGFPLGDEKTAKEKESCPRCGNEDARKRD